MARNNYSFEKRQRELAKKKKREEKRQQKSAARLSNAESEARQNSAPEPDTASTATSVGVDGS